MADTQYHSRDLTQNSEIGGVVIVTIPNPAADISPDSQPCLSCLVQLKSGEGYMNLNTAVTPATMATTTDWKLSTTVLIPLPITNLNRLHFCGVAGDRVQIIWRG